MRRHVRRIMAITIAAFCALGTPMMAKATDVGEASTRTLSPDNSLESLSISGAELSPAFYYSTVNYTATVSYDVTEVAVSAKTSNRNAAIESISGYENLSVGENTIKIVVVAENGNKATYTVKLTRLAEGETPAENGGADNAAADNDATDTDPSGDDTADAGTSDGSTADDQTAGDDTADENETQLPVGNTYFVPMDAPAEAVLNDMVQIDLELDGIGTVHAYQYVQGTVTSSLDELDFYFIYGTDADGNAGWYQYDRKNGAFQRYNERVAEQTTSDDNSALLNNYNLANAQVKQLQQKLRLMTCVFLFIVVVLLIIIFSILWSRRNADYDDGDVFEDEPEPDKKKVRRESSKAENIQQEKPAIEEPEAVEEGEELLDLNEGVIAEEDGSDRDYAKSEHVIGKKAKRKGSLLAYLGLDEDLPLDFGDVVEEDEEDEIEEESKEQPAPEQKRETKRTVTDSYDGKKEDSNGENDIEFIDL